MPSDGHKQPAHTLLSSVRRMAIACLVCVLLLSIGLLRDTPETSRSAQQASLSMYNVLECICISSQEGAYLRDDPNAEPYLQPEQS